MKKYLKITLLVVVAIILVGTFVFLYQKSKPKVITYETVRPEMTDLQKTTVGHRHQLLGCHRVPVPDSTRCHNLQWLSAGSLRYMQGRIHVLLPHVCRR